MVPVPVGAVLAGEDGVADQLVARQALKGDGLANVVTGSSYNTVGKRLRVRALLQLVGWGKNIKKEERSILRIFSQKQEQYPPRAAWLLPPHTMT